MPKNLITPAFIIFSIIVIMATIIVIWMFFFVPQTVSGSICESIDEKIKNKQFSIHEIKEGDRIARIDYFDDTNNLVARDYLNELGRIVRRELFYNGNRCSEKFYNSNENVEVIKDNAGTQILIPLQPSPYGS